MTEMTELSMEQIDAVSGAGLSWGEFWNAVADFFEKLVEEFFDQNDTAA